MLGVDFDLVGRLKFCKTRKEEPTKGKGFVYSWENSFRQPTKNGFVVIAQKWGQVLQHDYRIVIVRAEDERTCVPIVESCSEADSKLGATLIAYVIENHKMSVEGDGWDRLAGWWVEQQASVVITQLKNESADYGRASLGTTLDRTSFGVRAQKENELLTQQEMKHASLNAPVDEAQDLFQSRTKCGWLWKEGSKWKNWKKRWFRLTPHLLVYYNDMVEESQAGDVKLIAGMCELEDRTLRDTTRKEKGEPVFELYHVSRSLFMYAETPEERADWMEALRINCQYKEGVYNRLLQSKQEADIREADLKKELEETKKTLDELQAKTFLAAVHADERMDEMKRKEKGFDEIQHKLQELTSENTQQKTLVESLKAQNAQLQANLLNATAKAAAVQTEAQKVTLHVAEESDRTAEIVQLEAALEAALAQVFELKEQKKVLVKEVKRLTKGATEG